MKILINLLPALLWINSVMADTLSNKISPSFNYKVVKREVITSLQDSLEKDSLLEFRIDNIFYSNLSKVTLDYILATINNKTCPTRKYRVLTMSSTHYSYDEEKVKLYHGVTYVSISTNTDFEGNEITEITIFWSEPKTNPESLN